MKTDQEITAEIKRQVRHFRPGVYSWLAVLISSITLPVIALVVSLNLNQRRVDSERQARLASEKAMCAVVTTQDDAYRSSPPSTPAGRKVAAGMASLRLAYHCDER